MAKFYGKLQGNRGQATRCGTKSSGITTVAASWEGAVEVNIWHNSKEDRDMVEVCMRTWEGCCGESKVLYRGPVGEYKNELSGEDVQ